MRHACRPWPTIIRKERFPKISTLSIQYKSERRTGAGGNVGAVCYSLALRQLDYASAYRIMGLSILGSCFLSFFISIPGQSKHVGFSKTKPLLPLEQATDQSI